jgi:hypothetical protein
MAIENLTHPDYDLLSPDWVKWRLAYEGGREFIDTYLSLLSSRENANDFAVRKASSYCPAFAEAGINEIKNSIFRRLVDIIRVGGSKSYQDAVAATNGGVDLRDNSMNSFIGTEVLLDLLLMAKVGIFVDMPVLNGKTLSDTKNKRPYLYSYSTEDIRSWAYDVPGQPNEFSHILLRDHLYEKDAITRLPVDKTERFRYLRKESNGVRLGFFNTDGVAINADGKPSTDTYLLDLPQIPFVLITLPNSLMKNVADYQIALLNLESADINYARKANFPFYTEQFDPRTDAIYQKPANEGQSTDQAGKDEISVGPTQGRRYPINTDRPGFIHPSAEPLNASMKKGRQLKEDIRLLINLSLSAFNPATNSTTNKQMDNQGLESGLSFIGLTLEKAERQVAKFWAMYEGGEPATVNYPDNYSIKSEDDRQKEAEGKQKLMEVVPSNLYRREMAKEIVRITLSCKVPNSVIDKIEAEIDSAPTMTSDPKTIAMDWTNGFVSTETASAARGYSPDEYEKAKKDHAERIANVLKAQTTPGQARGNQDGQVGQATGVDEKVDKDGRGKADV